MRIPYATRSGVRWPRQVTADFPSIDPASVALTIDDGPTVYTREILAALDTHRVRATFFVVGELVCRRPNVVVEIVERGHNVGIHGWTHTRFPQLSESELRSEIQRTQDVLPVRATMVRPPYGDLDEDTLNVLSDEGLHVVGWSVHAEDWIESRPRADLAREIVKDVGQGDIVLVHDLAGATQILDSVLPTIVSRGLVWRQLIVEG